MSPTNTEKKNLTQKIIIEEAQKDLGTPVEKHYTKKTPLLKASFGSVVSNLAIAEYYDESAGSYREPEPSYSFYYMEKVVDSSGSPSNRVINIPIPKDAATFKAIADHFAKLAVAVEGIEFKKATSSADDLDAALNALKVFKR